MSLARPQVNVYSSEKEKEVVRTVPLPDVFNAPIRTDIVNEIHKFALMNLRQPYAVSPNTGMQHSAESWGTGRAVARIPRVSGGGTHRSGQGAFGNMCKSGRMFAPTKVWRVWAHKISTSQKRYATVSAIAASGVTALVMARGHKIERISEVPLVVSDDVQSYKKTKQAVAFLKRIRAYDDVLRVTASKTLRAGKGKSRNRRYRQKLGPLVIFKENNGIVKAFRNVPGVDVMSVDRLNLLKLAPGGVVGRFVIWTESAFRDLETRFGSLEGKVANAALKTRNGATFRLPRPVMQNTDLARIVESDEVQNVVRPVKLPAKRVVRRKNPLKNFYFMVKLNPLALRQKRKEILSGLSKKQGNQKQQKAAARLQERRTKVRDAFFAKYVSPLAK
jgi:large subunit ribosomal protein L4e